MGLIDNSKCPEWVVKLFMDMELIEDIRTPDNDRVFDRNRYLKQE